MTIGCILGVLDMDPIIEYWDASKTKTIKKSDGTNVSLNGDLIYTWQSSNGKRKFANIVTVTTELATYNTSTEWPALSMSYTAYQMSQSGPMFENGETIFMVFRLTSGTNSTGFCKINSSTTTANVGYSIGWGSSAYNGMMLTSGGFTFRIVINGQEYGSGNMGTVGTLPYLTVLGLRISQSGPNVNIWTIGNNGTVYTTTELSLSWMSQSNRNAFFQLMAINSNKYNCYYLEINRSITTTAQMLARRNVLYNLYAT